MMKYRNTAIVLCLTVWAASCQTNKTTQNICPDFSAPPLVQQRINEESVLPEEYGTYGEFYEKGALIPGLFQGAVPQGMAYDREHGLFIISNYMFDGRPSCLTVVSENDGTLQKTLWLLNPDMTPHRGHVGGVAVGNKTLWVTAGSGVYALPLASITDEKNNASLVLQDYRPTIVKASFAAFYNNVLWVGEFNSRDRSYISPASHHIKTESGEINHGWAAGYVIHEKPDTAEETEGPAYILSLPDEVQGIAFTDDKIVLSKSYGRRNNSRIAIYTTPLGSTEDSVVQTGNGRSCPLWILDSALKDAELIAPPMTEGVTVFNNVISVIFESGSDKYRDSAKFPQDSIHSLKNLLN